MFESLLKAFHDGDADAPGLGPDQASEVPLARKHMSSLGSLAAEVGGAALESKLAGLTPEGARYGVGDVFKGLGLGTFDGPAITRSLIDQVHDPRSRLLLLAADQLDRAQETGRHGQAFASRRSQGFGRTQSTERELEDEVARATTADEPLAMEKVEAIMARKERELGVEDRFGVDLQNLTGLTGKDVRVWSEEELTALERTLDRLPLADVQLASGYRREGAHPRIGGHYTRATEGISFFDSGAANDLTIAHEIGHAVAGLRPDSPAEAFVREAEWERVWDHASLQQVLSEHHEHGDPAAMMRQLDRQGIEGPGLPVGDGLYTRNDLHEEEYWRHQADAIPHLDEAQHHVPSAGMTDYWGYARTGGPDEHFAETYALAAVSPFTTYTDLMDMPNRERVPEHRREELAKQWHAMREQVFGVTDARVAAAADGLSAEERTRFLDQAERCATGRQLDQLRERYRLGLDLRPEHIQSAAGTVPAGQRAAFLADARNCVDSEVLERIRADYADGRRVDRNIAREP